MCCTCFSRPRHTVSSCIVGGFPVEHLIEQFPGGAGFLSTEFLNRVPDMYQHEIAGFDTFLLQQEQVDSAAYALGFAAGQEPVDFDDFHGNGQAHAIKLARPSRESKVTADRAAGRDVLTLRHPGRTLSIATVGEVMDRQEAASMFLPREALQQLLELLRDDGYCCVGPQERDGTIVYQELMGAEQLPAGVRQTQSPGEVRLQHTSDSRCFAWANGPQCLRPFLFAPREVLWRVVRDAQGQLAFEAHVPPQRPLAVLGVRACDLAALSLNDAHFLDQSFRDPNYAARRAKLFLIAVNCTHPAQTCFCASTGDGPGAKRGYDLLLDELDEGYVARCGTPEGAAVLKRLPGQAANQEQCSEAVAQVERAAGAQVRRLPAGDLPATLFANLEHPRWQDVAQRCLACGNCTLVCPTCFCHRESEMPSLDGAHSEHVREWDSCFTAGHSFIAGRALRADTRLRYRQWLTHKHGAWHQQYGRSGCVGCGRCIAWCPVGIDIVEELQALCT